MADTELLPSVEKESPWVAPANQTVTAGNTDGATPAQALNANGSQLDPATATEIFGHVASPTDMGITPRKVQTQTIRNDLTPLLNDIATGSNVRKSGHDIVKRSAGDLLTQAGASDVTGLNEYAYMLATAERESKLGTDMDENYNGKSPDAYFNKKYDFNSRLGNNQAGDGAKYFGRGLVQITGRRNYTDWTQRLADENYQIDGQPVDLVNHPELTMDPKLAAKIAVEGMRDGTFTTKKLGDYINANGTDYVNARKVINGKDHADEIAERAENFEGIIKQHKGEFYGSMMEQRLKKLPTATQPAELTAPTLNAQTMFSSQLMGESAQKFMPIDQFAHPEQIGKFTKPPPKIPLPRPRPADHDLPANVPIPMPRPRP